VNLSNWPRWARNIRCGDPTTHHAQTHDTFLLLRHSCTLNKYLQIYACLRASFPDSMRMTANRVGAQDAVATGQIDTGPKSQFLKNFTHQLWVLCSLFVCCFVGCLCALLDDCVLSSIMLDCCCGRALHYKMVINLILRYFVCKQTCRHPDTNAMCSPY